MLQFSSTPQPARPPSDPGREAVHAAAAPRVPTAGRIDIHSHLIAAVDDGCENLAQSLDCIRQLKQAGYTGSICTPHVWPELFPDNTMPHIRRWTAQLQKAVDQAGLDYTLWPGGELRLFDGVVDWMQQHQPPTLAGTRVVLLDFWEPRWRDWIDDAFDWLLEHRYEPILAHPERLALEDLPQRLDALKARGVRLQGNFRCLTGGEGERARRWMRQFLDEGRYDLLAMDVHRPDTLPSRIAGLEQIRDSLGSDFVDRMTIDAPRRMVFHAAQT